MNKEMRMLNTLLNLSLPYTCICKIETEMLTHTEYCSLMHVGKSLKIAKDTTEIPC